MKKIMKRNGIILIVLVILLFTLCSVVRYNYVKIKYNTENSPRSQKIIYENISVNDAIVVSEKEESDYIKFDNGIKVKGIINSRIFDDTIHLTVNMADGQVNEIDVPINKLKVQNQNPTIPTIEYWPLTQSIKKGRNVVLTAKDSTDADGDKITYYWEGRTAETAQYEVGQHNVRVKAIDEWGGESDWATYDFKVIDVEAATLTYDFKAAWYNLWGNDNITTYGNAGYQVVYEPNKSGTTIQINMDSIYDGNYVKIDYIVNNPTDEIVTYRVATHADIMINSNDYAPIYNLTGDKGFTMTDGTYYYNVYLRDTPGVDNVSTYWYGKYNERTSNLWNNCNRGNLTGIDSGMAFSWQNQTVQPGETKTLSIIIGLE